MEENKKNDQLDDELDVELDEEAEDGSEDDLDDDLEEYDIGDDEDGDDGDVDLDGDDDDPDEDGEGQAPEADAAAEDDAKATEENADGQQATAAGDEKVRAMMADMLDRLGYRGTYEEKLAAYEADAAASGEGKAGGKSDEDTAVDYQAMAEADLRDINAAFGTRHTDFSGFRNLERFALLRTSGATALEAYRATQPDVGQPQGEAQTGQALGKPSISHIKPLPRGGQGGSSLSVEDQRLLTQLRELYPELSKKDLAKKLAKVRRGR